MSNRLFAILFLAALGGISYGVYHYFFVANTGSVSLQIESPEAMEVQLRGEFKNDYFAVCEKTCKLENIPTTRYWVTVGKEGYETQEREIQLLRGEMLTLAFAPRKQIALIAYKDDASEKIQTLKLRTALQSATGSGNVSVLGYREPFLYYSKTENNTLTISRFSTENKKELVSIKKDAIRSVVFNGREGYILVDLGNKKRLFRLLEGTEEGIEMDGEILTIKNIDTKKWLIVKQDETFLFDVNRKTLTPISNYSDIVSLPNNRILGLLRKGDATRAELLNVSNSDASIFFLQDMSKNTRTPIYQTNYDIAFLEMHDQTILATDHAGNRFELTNIIE